ncbi:hypothetical protein ACQPZP_20300 [Spirillospora sp. CA-142024]
MRRSSPAGRGPAAISPEQAMSPATAARVLRLGPLVTKGGEGEY